MTLFENFRKGINLGGWLSQIDCLPCPPETPEELKRHYRTFITQKDIVRIASWGLDHVRLPVDYRVLEEEGEAHMLRRETLHYMDLCADWCEKHQLNLILDLHHAPGNVFGAMEEPMPLLTEEELRQRFVHIWEQLAEHFAGREKPVLMFELLNEVCDGSGYLWNRLYERTAAAIRAIDPKRFILVGSNEQNSVFRLKELKLLDDDRVFYNFHFYDPQVFTHQKAHFSEEMRAYDTAVTYPGDISGFTGFLLENRKFLPKYARVAMENRNDRELMERLLKDAFDFVRYSGRELYCGEFGVINTALRPDAAAWILDCATALEERGIGRALWNYKEMDFGLVDQRGEVISQELIDKLFGCLDGEGGIIP